MFVTNATRPQNAIVYTCGEGITFLASEPMKAGQEVYLSADDTVSLVLTATTAVPIGVVRVGTDTADTNVTVDTYFESVVYGIANGGTLAAGATVKTTGVTETDDELPRYAAVASGYCSGVVVSGGDAGEKVKVGLFSAIKLA